MSKVAQTEDRQVKLMVNIHTSYRRHLKAEAVRRDKEMGAVIEEALDKLIGPPPPPQDTEERDAE